MVQVRISYNVYLDAMSIYIDERPIPPVSRLTRFQTMPFGHWCSNVFQAIGEEVNDRFALTYVGRPCESRILGQFMKTSSVCTSYTNRQPELADSALTRLKRLSTLCQSGVTCDRFSVPVHVYTDLPEEMVNQAVSENLPKLAYCRMSVKLHPLQEAQLHRDASPVFVLTAGEPKFYKNPAGVCVLSVTNDYPTVDCRENCYVERVSSAMLSASLKEYMELLLFPYVLRKAMQAIRVPESSPLFPSVAILNKTEPQTLVSLPTSVELGQVAPVKIRTVPEGATPASLVYRISDESVVRMTDKGIQGVGTGEAVIEVYISGQASKICSGKIVSYRRNRIKQLQIKQEDQQISVGDRVKLTYSFEPKDADNESAIRMISSDGTVAAPESGFTFIARKPGQCRMILQAEQVSTDIWVKVFPRLEQLQLEVQQDKLRVGEIAPVKITRVPADATLDKLDYTVNPPSLGVYDVSTHSFYAKQAGTGTLTVSSKSHPVKATINLQVKAKAQSGGKGCMVLPTLITLGGLALFIISRFF